MSDTNFSHARLKYLLTHENAIVRHDVDYAPSCALQMARFEARLDVFSTYFVRPLREYETSPDAREIFAEIGSYGHDLGIHCDLLLPRDALVTTDELEACAEDGFASLSRQLPVLRRVSFHAPPRDVYWRNVPSFDHAMKRAWKGRHVADSRGLFRVSPEKKLDEGVTQLNLHPEWWFLPPAMASYLRQRESKAP